MLKNFSLFLLFIFINIPSISVAYNISDEYYKDYSQAPRCGGYRIAPGRKAPGSCDKIPNFKESGEPVVVFLNFEGGVITRGGDDPKNNSSWIPDYDKITIPSFNHEPFLDEYFNSRQKVIDAIVGWIRYYYADFNVTFTTVRPKEGSYQMMMIGGSASVITPNPGAMVGVSPFDCGNSGKNDVNYCFSDDLSSLADIVTTIVHENGHSFGLAHVDDVTAVMNPYVTYDPYWASGTVPDGQACDGTTSQDSYAVLSDSLGLTPDLEAPWADFVNPGNGATVGSSFKVRVITGDEDSLGRYVTLFVNGEEKSEKQWPDFTWNVSNQDEGKVQLKAVVSDNAGNSSTTVINVTVKSSCTESENCSDGKNVIGEECSKESSCNLGMCVVETEGTNSWCSTFCTPFTSSCSPGMSCIPDASGEFYYCAEGNGPVELKTISKDRLLGCNSSPGTPSSSSILFYLFIFTSLIIIRKVA